MPSWRTVLRWLSTQDAEDPSAKPDEVRPFEAFRQQYARAREARADARFESIDHVLYRLAKKEIDPQSARVMIDAIKWQAGKENAKRYGESVTVKGDKDNPLQMRTARELTDEELQALALGGLGAAT